MNDIRPVMRRQTFEGVSTEWGCSLSKLPTFIAMELNLFGDWYAVSLTSRLDMAQHDLLSSLPSRKPDYPLCLMGESLLPIS